MMLQDDVFVFRCSRSLCVYHIRPHFHAPLSKRWDQMEAPEAAPQHLICVLRKTRDEDGTAGRMWQMEEGNLEGEEM